jgi:hypothetical protein
MFKFTVHGRRTGRIALGAVLIAGAVILVRRLVTQEEAGSPQLLGMIWGAALAAYAVVGRIASRRTLEHADELAVPGLVVPSVGMALLLPLTLHLPVVALVSGGLRGFDSWALLGVVITAPTHLVFAVLAGHRARQLAVGPVAISPMKIFAICLGVSCVPFALLVLPPFIVMLTGLPLMVLMSLMEPLAHRDRDGGLAEALPRAIAMPALPRAEHLPRVA